VLLAEKYADARDPSDFLNHSCAPNIGMLDAITLVTIVEVNAEGELTVDYGYWEVDESYIMKNNCNCAGADCRSEVTGRDWQLGLQHLKTWSAPFIRRRMLRVRKERGG
jgi:hypothetical protein